MAIVVYKKQPEKYLKSVDDGTYQKLRNACEGLADGKGDVVRLQGSKYYRLKIEHYRAIFTCDKEAAVIAIEELNARTNIKYRRWR